MVETIVSTADTNPLAGMAGLREEEVETLVDWPHLLLHHLPSLIHVI